MLDEPEIESISAVTLSVSDMKRSLGFYGGLGFRIRYGGNEASFTSLSVGSGHLNLQLAPASEPSGWGRIILYVSDVDAMHARAVANGFIPEFEPRDASWGERYFHLRDPDGHELSFARRIS